VAFSTKFKFNIVLTIFISNIILIFFFSIRIFVLDIFSFLNIQVYICFFFIWIWLYSMKLQMNYFSFYLEYMNIQSYPPLPKREKGTAILIFSFHRYKLIWWKNIFESRIVFCLLNLTQIIFFPYTFLHWIV
jgi:hypothetical protein